MLYHKQIGFPKSLNLLDLYNLNVQYSNHAKTASLDDRYGKISIKETVCFLKSEIVEVETFDNKKVAKVVVRIPYDNNCDLVMAIQMENQMVKTVWLNQKCDAHRTLDRSKYDCPQAQQKLKAQLSRIKF
jgi:hypothetical protein